MASGSTQVKATSGQTGEQDEETWVISADLGTVNWEDLQQRI
jgi:hypothetical protein